MFRFIILVSVLVAATSLKSYAQQLIPSQGKVEVIEDERIVQLAEKYAEMSKNNPEIDGYRVQIFFDSGSNSKNKASSVKNEFDAAFPGMKSYLSYKEPYYRVRIGDFRTLIEAVGFQNKIAANYPNAYAVKDKISK